MTDRLAKVSPNVIDRVVAYFDPVSGAKRLAGRTAYASMSGGSYKGGRSRAATKGWTVYPRSADGALLDSLDTLRDRARDLDRNAPIARGALSGLVGSVIGAGLVPRPAIDREALGITGEAADSYERAIAREWRLWATKPTASFNGELTFAELQTVAFLSCMTAGDVFAVRRWKPNRQRSIYSTACQLVEAERVANPDGFMEGCKVDGGRILTGGIERTADGEHVAYHVRSRFHGENTDQPSAGGRSGPAGNGLGGWQVVPTYDRVTGRRRMFHVAEHRRPDAARAEPILAPVIEALKQLDDLTEAELTASVVSSLLTVFVKTKDGSGFAGAPTSGGGGAAGNTGSDKVELGKGAVIDLADGEDIETVDPNRPNEKFEPFFKAIVQQIGVALEIPFEVLMLHFTSSYSAARASLLQAWRMYRRRRAWFAARFCQPFYEAVIREAVLLGRLDLPGFMDDPAIEAAWCNAAWRGPAPGQLDPKRETEAAILRRNNNLSTYTRETAEITGDDWEQNEDERSAEDRKLAARISASAPPAPGGGGEDDGDDEDADPRDDDPDAADERETRQ